MPGRPTNFDKSRDRATVFALGASGSCLDIFSRLSYLSFLPRDGSI